MWQKARQIAASPSDVDSDRGVVGGFFWVKGPPAFMNGQLLDGSNRRAGRELRYYTNIVLADGLATVAARIVELLPEFADEVAPIPWDEFLAGKS